MNKKTDIRFMVGMVLLTLTILFIMVMFWATVSRQAQMDQLEEWKQEAASIHAICLEVGDEERGDLFLDMDQEMAFYCKTPAQGIHNRKGVLVKGDVLEYGDKVQIYGGDLQEEGTGSSEKGEGYSVLLSPEKMVRLGRASLKEAAGYEEILEELASALPEEGTEALPEEGTEALPEEETEALPEK